MPVSASPCLTSFPDAICDIKTGIETVETNHPQRPTIGLLFETSDDNPALRRL